MTPPALPDDIRLESLEVGAAPLIRLFLDRLDLPGLFERQLPPLPGRPPALPSATVLGVLLTNLLLARQPLYALADWAGRRVPEHLGLQPGQARLLNDDRAGRALDHLHRADRASLLTALVLRAVAEFDIDLSEQHQDTTTVTFSGEYAHQAPAEQPDRPPRITFGYNKDHRPDLKQLLYSVTISADGAAPVHCKTYDGNTTDDQVHRDTWLFLRQIVGHSDFLYVADSKLCTRENMGLIADHRGRFLTVMPRARSEDAWFRDHLLGHEVAWREVHREPNPRRRDGPDVVYHGVESPRRSAEGYRVLWYRSPQKEEQDRQARAERLRRARLRLEQLRPVGRGHAFRSAAQARAAGQRVLEQEQVTRWLRLSIEEEVDEVYRQSRPGRPGPDTAYRRVEVRRYRPRAEEDGEALARAARCDGLFPLLTNDEGLGLGEALAKYKYQPFVEKRHEQLKAVFAVTPMWPKSVARVESLLWLYYVVELVQALLEREVRQRMRQAGEASLALYPEGRDSVRPTAELVLGVLEGHRRHRLLDEHGRELRRFHDPLTAVAEQVLTLLGVNRVAYGLT
ncbi:MAG TPA: IS1634 family transposase [Gemmataceae bacterium]|nr:IS1634 family transposase [Gemmataceae bacterium]